jgi:hypothetical protein
MWPSVSNTKIPIELAAYGVDRLRRDRDVGFALLVMLDERAVVHAADVIAGEHQVVVGRMLLEVARALRTASAVPWNHAWLSGVCSAARISRSRPRTDPADRCSRCAG